MRRQGSGAYGATKAAVMSLTYSWALDLEDEGVTVDALSPMAATRMSSGSLGRTLVPRGRTPDRVAPLVTYLLSGLAAGVTGQLRDSPEPYEVPRQATAAYPHRRRLDSTTTTA